MKKVIAGILILVLGFQLNGKSQDMDIGLFAGGSYYLGDINPGLHFAQTKFAFGALARYNINDRLALRLNVYQGKVGGEDAISKFREERDLKFESSITDISAIFEFNFLPFYVGARRDFVSPYIFGGVGMFFFNPKADGVELKEMGTEGQNIGFEGRKPYSKSSFSIPFGIGVKYSLTKKIGIGFEWTIHKTFTDYIDDISTSYYLYGPNIDPAQADEILSDPTMSYTPYMQRGDEKTKDWYAFAGITITYKFNLGSRSRCLDQRTYN
jgi:opacity protein-like surface antigen